MTAGKGIVHSEMPEQEDGLLEGFQLWVNLPAADKMVAPAYQEFTKTEVPVERSDNGTEIRVVAGKTLKGTVGPVINSYVSPLFMDISLQAGEEFEQTVDGADNTLIYMIEGEVLIGNEARELSAKNLGILEQGDYVFVKSKSGITRFLLISAKPLNEPIARGGPFVMNTQDQVRQAFDDFKNNRF
jgi:redox-sensitive bicupin YhaK (pirin superfamily)